MGERKEGEPKEGESANEIDDIEPFQPLRNVADFYRSEEVFDRRIHIIGVGNVGRFIAHSIRGIPNPPPITLIFHRALYKQQWLQSDQKLRVVTNGLEEIIHGFDAEVAFPRPRSHGRETAVDGPESSSSSDPFASEQKTGPTFLEGECTEPIHSLIVCCKSSTVVSALLSVRHRLLPSSVILFLQNGMGTVDEVNEKVFPDATTRPHYMLGINSHGLNGTQVDNPFTTNHAGFGTIALGILPHARDSPDATKYYPLAPVTRFNPGIDEISPAKPKRPANSDPDSPQPYSSTWPKTARHLLRTLLRTPVLCATAFSPQDVLQLQLEKLAVNSVINPLTVLLDARNGAILYNYALTRVMRLLLAEASLVIRSLPELSHVPNVEQRFGAGRLETLVVGVANATRENVSSMLADMRAGRRTEIEYMNGWIVKRGELLGVSCVTNFMIKELVKGKTMMISHELGDSVPFVGVRGVDDGTGENH
ncbi:uncharacterized protein BDZ99DRAFT_466991 [Mytilinidion resinicola]|uniref:2-dehydropantoate 2-reductase n=1 Tax=Mytilinidion resinicola TaxID=574789 RepID=A0A6A6YB91_9PEZI|nr:uncharacterized protein BDZ99DRAFT_466991 [Mytilinidion resinicola]KAF2805375.1 hypothetical protein BDZ99DRAFT_466991 [Mytilinidion resinicola]